MSENSQGRLASIESKLEVILSKIDTQNEQISTLNDIVWRNKTGKDTMLSMTERQEVRLSSLEASTQKRLDFIQGMILATIPILLTAMGAVFLQHKENQPHSYAYKSVVDASSYKLSNLSLDIDRH